jgi:hypothetical protein
MDLHRYVERLEDLVVWRSRHLARWLRGEVSLRMTELYGYFADVLQENVVRTFLEETRVEAARSPQAWVPSMRAALWLHWESATAESLETVWRAWGDRVGTEDRPLAQVWLELLRTGASEAARRWVEGLDARNTLRLQWLARWQAVLRAWQVADGRQLYARWQGWDLTAWETQRRMWLESQEDLYFELYERLISPESGSFPHWSVLFRWPTPAEAAARRLAPEGRGLVDFLYRHVLQAPEEGYVEIQWWETSEPTRIVGAHVLFDGSVLWLLRSRTGTSLWDVWERLFLWGRAQPALWTPEEYAWTRLAGGDPSVPLGWGLWWARWLSRPSFWQALAWETQWEEFRPGLIWLDAWLGRWWASLALAPVETMGIPADGVGRYLYELRQDVQRYLGLQVEAELLLPWVVNRGWPLWWFRGWWMAEAVHRFLEDRWGTTWWKERPARIWLFDLWSMGTDLAVEDILKDLGFSLPGI